MKPFLLRLDANRNNTLARPASDYIVDLVLVAGAAQSVTVPAAAADGMVVLNGEGPFWVRANATAAVPVASVTDGTGSELNPSILSLEGVSTLSVISDQAIKVSLAFYSPKP